MDNQSTKADLLLLHAPAYFDFRNEKNIYYPFMSTSGDVPITPVYEFYPLGFKTLMEYIGAKGHNVKIFNLCSYMLQYKDADVYNCLRELDASVIGIDLHWLVHVQGALKVAEAIKKMKKNTYILFGGISSSYYAEELIQYPFIDFVMRGYDTHIPMEAVVRAVKENLTFENIPNLAWKDKEQNIHINPLCHLPEMCSNGVNWDGIPQNSTVLLAMNDIVSTTNVGCAFNCGWCGGSNRAFKRLYDEKKSPVYKSDEETKKEFSSLSQLENTHKFNFYSCGNYNLSEKQFMNYLDQIELFNFKSIDYEQYNLPDDAVLERMTKINKNTIITLSPESHDQHISKLAGRGNYSMDEMEQWIERALKIGIAEIDIWFFIGMPEQDEKSVFDTIKYCGNLLKKFKGQRVVPMICPMMPVLDPASNFFEEPDKYGYRIFYKTLEEHRQGMQKASIINRLNYETKWLSREQIVLCGYKAIKELFILKGQYEMLPSSIVNNVVKKLEDAVEFIKVIHKIDCNENREERAAELTLISDEIYKRNQDVFFGGVLNQAFPVVRKHGQRWFDYVQ